MEGLTGALLALLFGVLGWGSRRLRVPMLVVGVALLLLVLWFPKGILGTVRQKWLASLPLPLRRRLRP